MEDCALALGAAFDEALGDRSGIVRMGDSTVPLDEALVQAVVDCSGRPYAAIDFDWNGERIGQAPTEMISHALQSFSQGARVALHVRQLAAPTTTTSPRPPSSARARPRCRHPPRSAHRRRSAEHQGHADSVTDA